MAPVERIELPQADLEAVVLPLYYTGIVWWVVRESNPVCLKTADLQSTAVTNAAHYPRKF